MLLTKEKETALHIAAWYGHADVVKVLIQNGADVNAVDDDKQTALHKAAEFNRIDVVKVLLENGAHVNIMSTYGETALSMGAEKGYLRCIFHLLCFGAEISDAAIGDDKTKLLGPIEERLTLLRNGNRIGTSLMQNEGRKFMWNLAFFFTIKHRAAAFKAYYAIRSFITFHGIFMVPGYDLGDGSLWIRREGEI